MKLSGVSRRLELIPENAEDRNVIQDILDKKAVIYWGDAGEHEQPPEFTGGLILNTSRSEAKIPTEG